jgi:ADP-heptose:LPS heptosyltransferase
MIRLVFNQPANIDTQRNYIAAVAPSVPYLMTNYHVGRCVPQSACSEAAPYESSRIYDGEPLGTRSLLIHWLAGLGDTLTLAPALLSLQASNPHARIDILTIPVLFEILAAAGFNGNMIPYPAEVDTVERYDCYLALEEDGGDPDYLRLGSIDFRAKQLHQPQGLGPASFQIGGAAREKMRLPAGPRIRVGLQVRGLSPIRSYPPDLLAEVLRGLVRHGYEVHLLGGADDCPAPAAPPLLFNDCGKTANFAETAALVEQMDGMICPDSYLMHLAGALAIPTVAIFSTIPPHLRVSAYPSVSALAPDTPCAPCLAIEDDKCPLGHPECVALRSPTVSPQVILETVERVVAGRLSAQSAP